MRQINFSTFTLEKLLKIPLNEREEVRLRYKKWVESKQRTLRLNVFGKKLPKQFPHLQKNYRGFRLLFKDDWPPLPRIEGFRVNARTAQMFRRLFKERVDEKKWRQEYYLRNRERILKQVAAYQKLHPEKVKQWSRNKYWKDPEASRARCRSYHSRNRDRNNARCRARYASKALNS